jgi:gliding motility-associated-like protein
VTLNVNTDDSILWFNSSKESMVTFISNESSWYNIIVYNNFCFIYDSLYISVRDIFCDEDSIVIPTGFTPNNDNVNDTYKIVNNGVDLTHFNLKIYNRLGQEVFSTNDINVAWDGKYKEKRLNAQVLDYFLEMTCAGERMMFKKGNITLIE